MPAFKTTPLSGWARHPVERCHVYRPESSASVAEALLSGEQPSYVSRGLGRSYGDAGLNRDGGVISHVRLDRMLAFDPATGVLDCEAGVSLAEIIETFLPRGFFPPVTPGTKHVTVGGAIASDVHGKNHHVEGTFAEFLLAFRLLLPSGEVVECSRDAQPEVFWATVGGMGLTGAILSARIRLRRVESAYVHVDYARARDLDDVLSRFETTDHRYRYSVAWIDGLGRGAALGRSVLMQGSDAAAEDVRSARPGTEPLRQARRRSWTVPFDMPSATLNRWSVRAFNWAYSRGIREGRRLVDYEAYFYPLDRVGEWNRVYGRPGFLQYQGVLPPETARPGLVALLELLASARKEPFLAVLKRFGPQNPGLLSFPTEGYTLALDLPRRAGAEELVRALHRLTLRHGGRVYLAKDSMLTPEEFGGMYPAAERFREIRRRLDPDGRLSSSLARRVGLAS